MIHRLELTQVKNIPSSYRKRNSLTKLDVSALKDAAFICPDMADALYKLNNLVKENDGQLYITDLYRSWETQAKARQDFENGRKKAYVARPGSSFHNAARAVDFSVHELYFKDLPKDQWLDKLWQLAKPLGFHPIIKLPDEAASEAWHLDYPGPDWEDAYNKLSYSEVAKCCILDIGKWPGDDKMVTNMFLQSQLIRLQRYEIGKVDGIIGPKTQSVLQSLGMANLEYKESANILVNICKKAQ